MAKRKQIGKGVASILGGINLDTEVKQEKEQVVKTLASTVAMLPIEQIEAYKDQPRQEFEETAFTPTHFNDDYTVWLKNRMLYMFQNRVNTTENNLHKLDGLALDLANEFLEKKNLIRKRFVNFDWTKLKGERIRVHGDYHLGQVLVQGDDFFILDFEGEPESTIRDRKVKQPALKDVAGLFRSFHYAIYATLFNNSENYKHSQEDLFESGELLPGYLPANELAKRLGML